MDRHLLRPSWGADPRVHDDGTLRRIRVFNQTLIHATLFTGALTLLGMVIDGSTLLLETCLVAFGVLLCAMLCQRVRLPGLAGLAFGLFVVGALPMMALAFGPDAQVHWYYVAIAISMSQILPPSWRRVWPATLMLLGGCFLAVSSLPEELVRELAPYRPIPTEQQLIGFLVPLLLILDVLGTLATQRQHGIDDQERLLAARDLAEDLATVRARFLAELSHELRNPLGGLLGLQQRILADVRDEQVRLRACQAIQATEYLIGLLDDAKRMQVGSQGTFPAALELSTVDVRALVDEVVGIESARAEAKGIKLRSEVYLARGDLRRVDPRRLRQVLLNLVHNAIKFTEEGEVVIEVMLRSPGEVHFAVCDSGRGMSEAQLTRLRKALDAGVAYTSGDKGGSGLGLGIVSRIVTSFSGRLDIQSRLGEGTAISFVLPLAGRTEAAVNEDTAQFYIGGKRILVVDDEELNRMVAVRLIERMDHLCVAVESGEEAIRAARHHRFDLVLMDMHMKTMDGIATTRALRALEGYENVPVVALTAAGAPEDVARCLDAGMQGHILKPIRRVDLLACLSRLDEVPERARQPAGLWRTLTGHTVG